jgi:hypothetical protein
VTEGTPSKVEPVAAADRAAILVLRHIKPLLAARLLSLVFAASATLASNRFVASGWDSYTFDGSNFMGTLHIDTPYDPKLGGYGWAVELIAVGDGLYGGSATSDFGNTASLQSVTLPDGTPVTGVTFDSGLTFGPTIATPEPASLTLLGIGTAGFAGYGWRRRRRSA